MMGLTGRAVKGVLEAAKIIIRLGKKGPGDDGFAEDMDEIVKASELAIGKTNWFSGPPERNQIFTERTDAIVMGRDNLPESREALPEVKTDTVTPAKETLREKWRRLRREVEELEARKNEKRKT